MTKFIIGAAAVLAAAIATTAPSLAWERGPVQSDDNLRYSRAYLEGAIDMLSHDQSDYDGHKAAAMDDLQAARNDLSVALRYDADQEDYAMPDYQPADVFGPDFERNQYGSNQNVEYTRQYVERAIDMLQHDQHDYDGYRAQAVDHLQQARQQLLEALASR
jgi:hypothetical protein